MTTTDTLQATSVVALDDGELTLAELAQIVGGADPFQMVTSFSSTPDFSVGHSTVQIEASPFSGDVLMVPAKTDSAYSSYLGATGANSNEATRTDIMPLNLNKAFP